MPPANRYADIQDGSIVAKKLGAGAVITTKLADGAVTTDKVEDGAITPAKLSVAPVTDADVAAAVSAHEGDGDPHPGYVLASEINFTVQGYSATLAAIAAGAWTGAASLTTLGTIGTGVWHGTVIGPTYGGTGFSSYTVGDMLVADTTTTLSRVAAATAGYVWTSNGAGVLPSWQAASSSGAEDVVWMGWYGRSTNNGPNAAGILLSGVGDAGYLTSGMPYNRVLTASTNGAGNLFYSDELKIGSTLTRYIHFHVATPASASLGMYRLGLVASADIDTICNYADAPPAVGAIMFEFWQRFGQTGWRGLATDGATNSFTSVLQAWSANAEVDLWIRVGGGANPAFRVGNSGAWTELTTGPATTTTLRVVAAVKAGSNDGYQLNLGFMRTGIKVV